MNGVAFSYEIIGETDGAKGLGGTCIRAPVGETAAVPDPSSRRGAEPEFGVGTLAAALAALTLAVLVYLVR